MAINICLEINRRTARTLEITQMSIFRSAQSRLIKTVHRVRRYPNSVQRLRSILDDYEITNPIEVNGKIPLNYFTYAPNFGDLLSPWLAQQITGKDVELADRKKPHYVMIGSIVGQGTDQSILWGTGAYGTEGKSQVAKNAQFTAVRGPLTQAKLSAEKGFGIPVPEVYGDPSLLVPAYYLPDVPITHEYGVVVRWSERSWAEATYGPGVKIIDLGRGDIEDLIRELLSCRKIATSSLHGLIIADAYGVPSAWLASSSPRGGVFKFYDYFASVGKFRQPHQFDPTSAPVTIKRLHDQLTFDSREIQFDHRALLDASPLMRQKARSRSAKPVSVASREPGRELWSRAGRNALLPSLGYFGAIDASYLSVPVTDPISRIRLFLPDSEGELDLRGLSFFSEGRRVQVDGHELSTAQSSTRRTSSRQQSPYTFANIRTKKEVGPWWSVTFDSPVDADEIRIYNRRSGWGIRSRALTINVAGPDGRFRTVQSVDSDRVIEETLALLRHLTGLELDLSVLDSHESGSETRRLVLAALARRAGDGLITADREEQRLLVSLLRTQPLPEGQTLTDDEWTLLGHLLAAERVRMPSTKTSMVSFHRVLDSRAKLTRLESEVNRAGQILGTPEVVITRHGFANKGMLQNCSEDLLGLMRRAASVLDESGYPAMLAYGTLLGAVREGNFLAHDDDVDMLIPMAAATRDEVEELLGSLAKQLRSKGWKVTRPNASTNFHLSEPATKLHIDVFPLWVNGSRSNLHMERMRLREIPTDMILPAQPFTFLGQKMLVPAAPESFLAERYGSDWATPDRFCDWPWDLQS